MLGLVATCNVGGSRCWRDEYVAFSRASASTDHRRRRRERPISCPADRRQPTAVAASVRMIEFADVKDLTEWVAQGGTREILLELVETIPAVIARGCERMVDAGRPDPVRPHR